MTDQTKKWLLRGGILIVIIAVALGGWWLLRPKGFGPGIVAGNGRTAQLGIRVTF